MEEYEYLESLSCEELAQLICEMLDFEETTKALMILEEKDKSKAIELGKDIIKNDKGDDYLQATVWSILFLENQNDMIEAIDERQEEIGKTLLDEIMDDLTTFEVTISTPLYEKLRNSYKVVCLK